MIICRYHSAIVSGLWSCSCWWCGWCEYYIRGLVQGKNDLEYCCCRQVYDTAKLRSMLQGQKHIVTMNENWFKLPHYWIYLCKYLLPKPLMTMTPQYTIINKRCPLLHKCRLSATEASMLNTVLIKMTIYSSGIPTWFLLAGRGGTLLLRGLGVSCPKCTEGLGVWARD